MELFSLMPDMHFSVRFLLVVGALATALLLVGLAKRLHDCGHSGAWGLLLLVPVIGWIAVVLLCAEEGTPGPNAAGSAPLELTDARW